ncbi:unnamed protein product [Symbiodinium sp. CCMP2456]|nr:unnamed protein product [Symbiodinium sp. CCMP2456]
MAAHASNGAPQPQNFVNGWPHPGLLSGAALREDLAESFRRGVNMSVQEHSLNYGNPATGSYMLGHPKFLQAMATFLKAQYHEPVDPKSLMSTVGASMGTDLCFRAYGKAGDICVFEEPGYFLSFQMARDQGLELKGVPMYEDGMDLDALEQVCKESMGKVKLVYTVPVHHNPTGYITSNEKRVRLLQLARDYQFFVVADETYQLLNFQPTEVKPLFYHDDPDDPRVFSIGTFSKLIGPGIKVGWVQAHPKLLQPLAGLGFIRSGNNPVIFSSMNLLHFVESGALARHIEVVSKDLGERCQLICRKLREVGLEVHEPKGGYSVWVKSKGKMTGRGGQDMAVKGDKFHDYMRLCYGFGPGSEHHRAKRLLVLAHLNAGWLSPEQLEEGIECAQQDAPLR